MAGMRSLPSVEIPSKAACSVHDSLAVTGTQCPESSITDHDQSEFQDVRHASHLDSHTSCAYLVFHGLP